MPLLPKLAKPEGRLVSGDVLGSLGLLLLIFDKKGESTIQDMSFLIRKQTQVTITSVQMTFKCLAKNTFTDFKCSVAAVKSSLLAARNLHFPRVLVEHLLY